MARRSQRLYPIPYVRPLRYSRGVSTLLRTPRKTVERRIKVPQPLRRPIRFQARTIIRHEELRIREPFWFTLHRRGPHRGWEGVNQLEARAVPRSEVRGTLPERIVWKYLVEAMHFVPGVDFTFQSSLQGGRVDTGGIVADFLFPYLRIVIQVQGPTHREFLRAQKDEEQTMALTEMGYQVYDVWEDSIYNEYLLDDKMRLIFSWYHGGGADTTEMLESSHEELDSVEMAILIDRVSRMEASIRAAIA